MSVMRLFTATAFGDETLEQIKVIRDMLIPICERGTFTHQDNIHLTLRFIGDKPSMAASWIKSA